jgi:hypothetical protein
MSREEIKTVKLDVKDIIEPTWATIVAMLERVSPQGVFALRLGFIEQAHRILDEMSHADARPDLVNKLRYVTEVLAHLPWS